MKSLMEREVVDETEDEQESVRGRGVGPEDGRAQVYRYDEKEPAPRNESKLPIGRASKGGCPMVLKWRGGDRGPPGGVGC